MPEYLGGFKWGLVTNGKDPQGLGRVRLCVPGMFEPEHPHWSLPLGWPGGGHPKHGSQYHLPIGAQVAVLFEQGDLSAPTAYLPGMYGAQSGVNQGPTAVSAATDGKYEEVQALWEDETFTFYVTAHENDKQFILVHKATGSGVLLNATDGANKKSVSLSLFGNTAINLQSLGIIDIKAPVVQINGRRVLGAGGSI